MCKNITPLFLFLNFNHITLKMIFLNHTICLHPYNFGIRLRLVKVMRSRETLILILIWFCATDILLFTQYLMVFLLKSFVFTYNRCDSTMLYIILIPILIFIVLFGCFFSQKFVRILFNWYNLLFMAFLIDLLRIEQIANFESSIVIMIFKNDVRFEVKLRRIDQFLEINGIDHQLKWDESIIL